uniref:Uncharacterized protein n=1 Tax=Setaria viridis TaxID=4556 RepID=A0A4U6V6Z4_SETVI|nr:hypothetical protein SEVIR_4G033502v2 [Setaria viridis]
MKAAVLPLSTLFAWTRVECLKAALWTLTMLLTVMFASTVAPLMPPAVGAVVWSMAAATAAGGFWAFFLNP